jgi:hypothetical protein
MVATSTPSLSKYSSPVTPRERDVLANSSPLGYAGGGLNLYEYVNDCPIDEVDPTGLAPTEPPLGDKGNGYDGIGVWKFKTIEEALAFFNILLDPKGNRFPKDWVSVAKDGCKGINLLRCGWNGLRETPRNAFYLPDAEYYTTRSLAEARLKQLSKDHPNRKYLLIAAQLPTIQDGQKIAKALGTSKITIKSPGLRLDHDRMGDFNFATWFPAGYWEYMNHHWNTFDPKDLPALKHQKCLPDLGKKFLTLYGVVQQRPWKK